MLLPAPATAKKDSAGETVPAVARSLPSFTDIAFLMPVMFIFMKLNGARSLLGDGDTGWHLRTGDWILAHGQVPRVDMFSYSRPGAPWVAWEWLWDVIFATLHGRWGMAAVVLANLVLVCLINVTLFRLVRRKCNNGLVAIAVTLLATGGCAIHWLARPHLFTLFFFALTLNITERAAEGRTRLLWWLVPLTLVWTNLHAGFFILFLVFPCYIASDLLNAAIETDPVRRRNLLCAVKPWLQVALACFAITFINPYGWKLHQHVIEYLRDPYQLEHIMEFQGMDFHLPIAIYFEPLMIGALLTVLWDARRRRFADVFMSLGWMHLALIAQRNLPLFAIAVAPPVARGIVALISSASLSHLPAWLRSPATWFVRWSGNLDKMDRIARVHLVSVMTIVVVGALLLAPGPASAQFTSSFDPKMFPEGALSQLRGPESRHIFTTDQWGDYLIYRLYPAKQVFVDGRSDFYGDKFGDGYLDLLNVKYDWQKTLDRYAVDTIVLSPTFALASTLKISRDWRVVYDDGTSVVFRRNRREQASLASSDGGENRDRAITKTTTRDRRITPTT